MPNIGPLEIVVILIIVLLLFGAKRIPEVGRSLGKGIRGFKSSLENDDEDEADRREPAQVPSSTEPRAEEGARAGQPGDRAG